jgi:epoxide hydrolase 4
MIAKSAPIKPIIRPEDFHHEYVQAGNLKMHTVLEGPSVNAPLVVMLHGFPEFWYGWRHQIKALTAAGFRVAAPDMRGYNLTEKHGPHDPLTIAADIANFVKALGYERAHIVGHDWGAYIAWVYAALHRDRLDKLIICNVPHPYAARKAVQSFYLPQFFKSWYIMFFQLPFLPEWLLSLNNFQVMYTLMKGATSGKISDEELAYYREAWSQRGTLTAMINYYRSLKWIGRRTRKMDLTVHAPARMIWGAPDVALDTKLAMWSVQYCPGLDLKIVPDTGHFVQHEVPELVSDYIVSFLKEG